MRRCPQTALSKLRRRRVLLATINMTYSMNGLGILQANQNTGAASVQGNSVALTSSVGGNGGGLAGFSPSAVPAVTGAAAH